MRTDMRLRPSPRRSSSQALIISHAPYDLQMDRQFLRFQQSKSPPGSDSQRLTGFCLLSALKKIKWFFQCFIAYPGRKKLEFGIAFHYNTIRTGVLRAAESAAPYHFGRGDSLRCRLVLCLRRCLSFTWQTGRKAAFALARCSDSNPGNLPRNRVINLSYQEIGDK